MSQLKDWGFTACVKTSRTRGNWNKDSERRVATMLRGPQETPLFFVKELPYSMNMQSP
jgi:hypothetical protein